MTELGLPLTLAVELQSRNLRLDSSLWTTRSLNGGYTVLFFWPSPLQRKRRKRRRLQRKPPNNHPAASTTNFLSTDLPFESHLSNTSRPLCLLFHLMHTLLPEMPANEPDASHSPKVNESTTSTGDENTNSSVKSDPPRSSRSTALDSDSQQHVDLEACTDVKYEKRGGVHGGVVHAGCMVRISRWLFMYPLCYSQELL